MDLEWSNNNKQDKKVSTTGGTLSKSSSVGETREPRHTKERDKITGWIKAARGMPFERIGVKNLENDLANRAGMKTLSIGGSSLEFRELQMGVDFVREIKRILKSRSEGRRANLPVRILDVGAGTSTFLSQLKKQFGTKIETHSVDIRFFSPDKFPQKKGTEQHVHHVDRLSTKLPHKYFDMIVDNRGGMLYAFNRERALDEIYAVLAYGSSVYIFPKPRRNLRNIFNKNWIEN